MSGNYMQSRDNCPILFIDFIGRCCAMLANSTTATIRFQEFPKKLNHENESQGEIFPEQSLTPNLK